jgi:biopolymer transport protein ExbB/TolQ
MVSVIVYTLLLLAIIIVTSLCVAGVFLLFVTIKDYFKNRKIPKNKEHILDALKENTDYFAFPVKQELNLEEVKQDEQREQRRFREFEKLRRLEQQQRSGNREINNTNRKLTTNDGPKEQRVLQTSEPTRTKEPNRTVTFD